MRRDRTTDLREAAIHFTKRGALFGIHDHRVAQKCPTFTIVGKITLEMTLYKKSLK